MGGERSSGPVCGVWSKMACVSTRAQHGKIYRAMVLQPFLQSWATQLVPCFSLPCRHWVDQDTCFLYLQLSSPVVMHHTQTIGCKPLASS